MFFELKNVYITTEYKSFQLNLMDLNRIKILCYFLFYISLLKVSLYVRIIILIYDRFYIYKIVNY